MGFFCHALWGDTGPRAGEGSWVRGCFFSSSACVRCSAGAFCFVVAVPHASCFVKVKDLGRGKWLNGHTRTLKKRLGGPRVAHDTRHTQLQPHPPPERRNASRSQHEGRTFNQSHGYGQIPEDPSSTTEITITQTTTTTTTTTNTHTHARARAHRKRQYVDHTRRQESDRITDYHVAWRHHSGERDFRLFVVVEFLGTVVEG